MASGVYEPKNDVERAALIIAGAFGAESGWTFHGLVFDRDYTHIDLATPTGEFVRVLVDQPAEKAADELR